VPGVEQGPGLVRGQVLDAQRAGQPEDDPARIRGASPIGVVVGRVDLVGRFTGQVQRPPVEPGRGAAPAQRVDQVDRPQVLVDVDGAGMRHGRGPFAGCRMRMPDNGCRAD
jgi:hypothetical protein